MEEVTVPKSTLHPSFRPFRDYLVTMVPLVLLATYLYGLRVVVMLAVATVTSVLCDLFVAALRQRHIRLSDISSFTFAWTVTLMLPTSASYSTVIFAVCATLLLGKHAFGGYGSYPFHPAAFGYCLTAMSAPDQVFLYPLSGTRLGFGWNLNVALHQSLAQTLHDGGVPLVDRTDLLLGDFNGPMGENFCLIIASCLILLIVHRAVCWQVPVAYLATCALWAFLFPRIPAGNAESVLYEMFCCGIPFAAAYLVAEPTITPKNSVARVNYGIVTGALTMAISRFGVYEVGAPYAVLLSAPFGYWMDRLLTPEEDKEARNG
ncbi:MAG: RnfABCDGE type electron transport complex subunit D [Oscillospiraceae bacterium]|nr:RnfABCDGE type electron transport complex subunit D [Oscillospiraceae bacterium]